jgi:hypothetical protein
MGAGVANLAIRLDVAERTQRSTTGAHHELPYASRRGPRPIRSLGRKPLVGVVVAVDHDIGSVVVQDLVGGSHLGRVAMVARAEERVVPVGESAFVGVGGEVLLEPAHHRRGSPASAHLLAHRVEGDYVPVASVVGVVALLGIPSRGSEVVEVARSARRIVLVVAYARLGARFVASPGGVVAGLELSVRSGAVGVVAGREDGTTDAVEQLGRGLVGGGGAVGYVPGADQHRPSRRPRRTTVVETKQGNRPKSSSGSQGNSDDPQDGARSIRRSGQKMYLFVLLFASPATRRVEALRLCVAPCEGFAFVAERRTLAEIGGSRLIR